MEKRYEDMSPEEKLFYNELLDLIRETECSEQYEASRQEGKINTDIIDVTWDNYKNAYLYYKKKYENIRDASFWRMTEPLRKLVDFIRWKKTGIKKLELRDEISVPSNTKADEKVSIGVHVHLFYEDLLEEFCGRLNFIPEPFDLYISCRSDAHAEEIRKKAAGIRNVRKIVVRETQNRGRDIAPFYVLFGKELVKYEYVLHIHSKKSLYTGGEQAGWRQEALDGVLKDQKMVTETLRLFRMEKPEVGLVFGEMTGMLPLMALHWLQNAGKGKMLLDRLHVPFRNQMFLYPVGSFFWARMEAIKPLFDLGLTYQDFDEEKGQTDGTLAHVLERAVAFLVRHRNYDMYIFDAETDMFLRNMSYKSFRTYFTYNAQNIGALLKKTYEVISFDIFDTLITRLIYQPDDLFRLMGRKIENRYQKRMNFLAARKEAERIAWEERGDFCNIHDIYEKLPEVSTFSKEEAEELKQMEIELEYDLCIPRLDVRDIFNQLKSAGKKIILISDMYLPKPIIERMLEKCGYQGYDDLWISCEMGKRKDRGTIWEEFQQKYGKYRSLHVGDNPQSDCQIVGDRRMEYLLLLSPVDQFRFSAQYDKFSKYENTTVENSLVLGFLVNKCFYNSPFALKETGISMIRTIEDVAQGIFAPVLLKYMDYLHMTSHSGSKLLFLSREGYFLERLYQRYCKVFDQDELEHVYFLTSRRATSVAQIRNAEDILALFKARYTGRLSVLLEERFGLGNVRLKKDVQVTLPRDASVVMKVILEHVPELLRVAEQEKEMYLRYIEQTLGKNFNWEKAVLVDVGYSGTIQYYLMKILEAKMDGCYMVTGYEMKPDDLGGTYRGLYNYWRSPSFIDTQLFLEAVTAAPHGQVVKFCQTDGEVKAKLKTEDRIYGEKAAVLQEQIYRYVDWMGRITEGISPRWNADLAENIFSEILRYRILGPELSGEFFVNDGYCMDGNWSFNTTESHWELNKQKVSNEKAIYGGTP